MEQTMSHTRARRHEKSALFQIFTCNKMNSRLVFELGPVCWPDSRHSKPTLDHNLHLRPRKYSTILK